MDSGVQIYEESTCITLEWKFKDLKNLFESSKGEGKSTVIRSSKFGGGHWQVLFYANSGTEGGSFVSLYLSCEPTADEREKSINNRWLREGLYKFNFEILNLNRANVCPMKEACDHSFSYKTANWGWAQFARRDTVYYGSISARHDDAFLIVCRVTSQPQQPTIAPAIPTRPTPRDLLSAVGDLLDDPHYSDVVFVFLGTGRGSRERQIFAAKKLLSRVDYFKTMFNSGFSENSLPVEVSPSHVATSQGVNPEQSYFEPGLNNDRVFDDSDVEEDWFASETNRGDVMDEDDQSYTDNEPVNSVTTTLQEGSSTVLGQDLTKAEAKEKENQRTDGHERNVQPKLSHPSSPRGQDFRPMDESHSSFVILQTDSDIRGTHKARVLVEDVAYATYRAVLYYVYTDVIVFAPLSSAFAPTHLSNTAMQAPVVQTPMEGPGHPVGIRPVQQGDTVAPSASPTTRREWIDQWEKNHPGLPRPCSAKAVYRLADKLGMQALKDRAFKHIFSSLTVENVPYEMFSKFSGAFEDIRKVQIKYFLDHWADIRAADAMIRVWQQIRVGRHPGFEEVWPLIASNLEYRPRTVDSADADASPGESR